MYVAPFPIVPDCEEEWEITQGTGTVGGQFVRAESTTECLALCLADPYCTAVDISNQAPFFCFLHSNDSLHNNEVYFSEFISQHVLLNRCPCTLRLAKGFQLIIMQE